MPLVLLLCKFPVPFPPTIPWVYPTFLSFPYTEQKKTNVCSVIDELLKFVERCLYNTPAPLHQKKVV